MPPRSVLLAGVALVLAAPALAQDAALPRDAAAPPGDTAVPPRDTAAPPRDGGPVIQAGDVIDFAADQLTYDDTGEIAIATGNVEMRRDAYLLSADTIEYNRKTGVVVATGNVVTTDPDGNQAFGDRIELTEALKDGAIDNILLVLADGGRLAAGSGRRVAGIATLNRAVYSPCRVEGDDGCPKTPVWQIKALQVVHNPARHRISYRGARIEMFGVPILYLPRFSHPDGFADRVPGLLLPQIELRKTLGLGVGLPMYIPLGSDRDVTITPYLFTSANPALKLQARRLFGPGPVQADAFFTYAQLIDFAADGVTPIDRGKKFRGYLGLKGRFQLSSEWRSTFSLRLTTDDTFNRLYGLDYDDSLRSNLTFERFRPESYLAISLWGFQGLNARDTSGQVPFALPLVDYDWRPSQPVLGGRLRFGVNTLNLVRRDGQSVRRGLAFGRWDRSFLTGLGQRVTATALLRGDLYNTSDPDKATLPIYAGTADFKGRVIPAAALDIEWPFAGPFLGGTQTITPRVQLVASPRAVNNGIPNEDSRSIELEDINLFDLNRFPGFDRWEGGSRVTYGLQYTLTRPNWALTSEIGQSARLDRRGDDFPTGTGLSGTLSDFVGRTTVKYRSFVELTHRFRVDKDTFAVRRNEIDLAVGTRRTYATLGYLKLKRNIAIEDLADREELRAGGRVAFARFWSAFGSVIIDLTNSGTRPVIPPEDGFSPIRHRLGVQYEDDCFRFGVTWRRDYITDRDLRAGNSYQLSIAFKNIGF